MKTLFLLFTTLFSLSLFATDSAEVLFDAKCSSCHLKTKPQDMSSIVAPPIVGVMKHVNKKYQSQDDAIKFIVTYTMNPQKEKSVCKSKKLKRFGIMPSQKGNLTKKELTRIARWMSENFSAQKYGRHCN